MTDTRPHAAGSDQGRTCPTRQDRPGPQPVCASLTHRPSPGLRPARLGFGLTPARMTRIRPVPEKEAHTVRKYSPMVRGRVASRKGPCREHSPSRVGPRSPVGKHRQGSPSLTPVCLLTGNSRAADPTRREAPGDHDGHVRPRRVKELDEPPAWSSKRSATRRCPKHKPGSARLVK
jgi:hypothetical protein